MTEPLLCLCERPRSDKVYQNIGKSRESHKGWNREPAVDCSDLEICDVLNNQLSPENYVSIKINCKRGYVLVGNIIS